MTKVTVGRWGKSLALRVPVDIAEASGLSDGEQVDLELKDGDILVRRSDAKSETHAKALETLDRLFENSRDIDLDGISFRELIEEGRRN